MNLEKLKGHVPDSVIAQIPSIQTKFEINTPLRLAHFLAQCGHESGGFRATQENLNYSAKGLRGIFGKYFPTDQLAEQYQKNLKQSHLVFMVVEWVMVQKQQKKDLNFVVEVIFN